MGGWRNAARSALIAVLACSLVAGAVGLGLRVPATALLPPLPSVAGVSPSRLPFGALPPLTDAFVARVLGGSGAAGPASDIASNEVTAGPAATAGAVGGRLPADVSVAVPDARTVVSHALTNDDRRDAYEIGAVPFTARADTTRAAREPDEPSDCSPTGGTVWYRYRADRDRNLVATTVGTAYAASLAVFEGRDDGTQLRQLGCDVDAGGNARVAFSGRAGRTYFFQVAGPAGGGALVFNLDVAGTTTRVSLASDGSQADDYSQGLAIAADGRRVAFASTAKLTPDDRDDRGGLFDADVYVRDLGTGRITLVSVSSTGEQANDFTDSPAISGDGRYVAFYSSASNLVPGDTNRYEDVFVHDLLTRTTVRASVSSSGQEGTLRFADAPEEVWFAHRHGYPPSLALSHDGRHVTFSSDLAGLVPGDTQPCTSEPGGDYDANPMPQATAPTDAVPPYRCRDIFVRDVRTATTVRVSVASSGEPANGDSSSTHITPDGRFVVFASGADNLVADDANLARDVFVHDRDVDRDGRFDEPGTVSTVLVSRSSTGAQGNGNSGGSSHRGHATISGDGRYVAFMSDASNLVPGDGNLQPDVFLRDRATGTTTVVSVPRRLGGGEEQHTTVDGDAHHAAISVDGRYVAFTSAASNLVSDDHNGARDAFVYDRVTSTITRVSVSSDGTEGNDRSFEPDLSADGAIVAFTSAASNLVEDDTNSCVVPGEATASAPGGCLDIFTHQRSALG